NGVDHAKARSLFKVYASLYGFNPADGSWVAPTAPPKVDTKIGVPARLAAQGRLMLCVESACPPKLAAAQPKDKKQMASDFPVLQLGQIYVLPVTGGAFKSESAAITLSADGVPTQLQTSEKAAAAAGLTGSAKDAATQLAALPAGIRA